MTSTTWTIHLTGKALFIYDFFHFQIIDNM